MNLKYLFYNNLSRKEWDELIYKIPKVNYRYSWSMISYYCKFEKQVENRSFILIGDNNKPFAVVLLGITKRMNTYEFSFGGNLLASPLIIGSHPSFRRKLLSQIWNEIDKIAEEFSIGRICLVQDSFFAFDENDNLSINSNLFELLPYTTINSINNTLVIDLKNSIVKLEERLNKYHRKNIKRAKRKGVLVKLYNNQTNANNLKNKFDEFEKAHYIAAGGSTRPKITWEAMYLAIIENNASLFIAYLDEVPIGYLFCGEFNNIAVGWSQVSIEKYQKILPVRHYLEWYAILYYKKTRYNFYEIGIRYKESNLFYKPPNKRISISDFKERYGGDLYPQINWFKYYDKKQLKNDIINGIDNFN